MKKEKRNVRKKSAKKAVLLCCGMIFLLAFSGCKTGKEHGKNSTETGELSAGTKVVPQEFSRGGADYMITDTGWYTVDTQKGIRYFDFTSGKELPLCNKPECRHDGNQFCVATNAKYQFSTACLYSGRIYLTAIEETDTQYLYKLLFVTLDGSESEEIATYYVLEKTEGLTARVEMTDRNLFIQQNKAFLPMEAIAANEGKDLYGTAVLDLDTKAVTYLDETPLSGENFAVRDLRGVGNIVYYWRREGRKYLLYRYNIKNNEVEECHMKTNFCGLFEVVDEDTVAHTISVYPSKIYYYHHGTGVTDLQQEINLTTFRLFSSYEFACEIAIEEAKDAQMTPDGLYGMVVGKVPIYQKMKEIKTDGTYFYYVEEERTNRLAAKKHLINASEFEVDEWYTFTQQLLQVYDKEFQIIAKIDIYHALQKEMEKEAEQKEFWFDYENTKFLGEYIYLPVQIQTAEGEELTRYYRMKRSDLLAENPVLEAVWTR